MGFVEWPQNIYTWPYFFILVTIVDRDNYFFFTYKLNYWCSLKVFAEGEILTTVLAMQIFISKKSAVCFFCSLQLLCCLLCILVCHWDCVMTKPISMFFSLSFEYSLRPVVIISLQKNTYICCRHCRKFLWIIIIKFLVVSQASNFLIYFLVDFVKMVSTSLPFQDLICVK